MKMSISKSEFTTFVRKFKFKELFNYLGWDNDNTSVPIQIDEFTYTLQCISQKRGFRILTCTPDKKENIPPYAERLKINNKVKKLFHDHLIIYVNAKKSEQLWQLVYKQNGLTKNAEIRYDISQSPEKLYQRASGLFFNLDDEDKITIIDVANLVRTNFGSNAEKVTKKFYDDFKKHHKELLSFITGIDEQFNKDWYASLMLNRLMFCYFIQKQGFLDGDKDYLRNKLKQSKEKHGNDKFYSFYRQFLLVLFHQGLGSHNRNKELIEEIGNVPYLNGGLFDEHEIEKRYPDISIEDDAFESIFDFFDEYDWHLDNRVTSSGKEINPDVLGYIFEKYINDRAQMGAYYTQEDITDYISKSCIIPYLFNETKKKCPVPFQANGSIWTMLKQSGDQYIYDAVKKGVDLQLPSNIEIGVDTSKPNLLERRKNWNQPANEKFALPTEIWRETIERRQKYKEVLGKIQSGAITDINDFITYNLDVCQFAQDVIDNIDDPDFIRCFYKALSSTTILDPTCGSGAFLFAALNVLEPLYEKCINRMDNYCHDSAKRYKYFEDVLYTVDSERHPNRQYFIYKAIILNNLYGVDIMPEAVETAKLRLFLKLVSTVEPNPNKENMGLEPLPDIDFNIKTGNSLVGYANEAEIDQALETFEGKEMRADVLEKCLYVERATDRYKKIQMEWDENVASIKDSKEKLLTREKELAEILNKRLSEQYGVDDYSQWVSTYNPFHWVAEYYDIIAHQGGFDIIIGNPPYVEYSKVKKSYRIKNYETEACGNLYAFIIERCMNILNDSGMISMIVPISAFSNSSMICLQDYLKKFPLMYISSFHQRPAALFEGVLQRLSIFIISKKSSKCGCYTSGVYRWYTHTRPLLFPSISYVLCRQEQQSNILKVGSEIEISILNKYYKQYPISKYLQKGTDNKIYYRTAGGGYWVTILNTPFESTSLSNKSASFNNEYDARVFSSVLNSNLFWWIYSINYDLFNFKDYMLFSFRFNYSRENADRLIHLSNKLENELNKNAVAYIIHSRTRGSNTTKTYNKFLSKGTMDTIDCVLAEIYDFTEEELDYIINYDIKYRMGGNADDE